MEQIIDKKIEEKKEIIESNTKQKHRYDNIDILKIIAIFMVIMLHTLKWETNFLHNESLNTYIQFFIRIFSEGVPIFILVNGFLIINKNLDFKKFLKKIVSIFVILLIWSFIDVIAIKWINGENINIKEIIKNVIITDINNKYTGPLWFLQNLIMLYLIFPVLKVAHDSNKKIYNYFFVIVTIFTVGISLINNMVLVLDTSLNLSIGKYLNLFVGKYNPIYNGSFIFYFMLGGYLFEHKEIFEKTKNRVIVIVIGIMNCIISFSFAVLISKITNRQVASSFNYSSIFMAIFIIALYALTYKYKNRGNIFNKLITSIGKNTLGIYLVHKILIVFISKNIIIPNHLNVNIIFSISIFIVSYIFVVLIRKIPILKKIVEI